jgi:hypothetical protein
MKKLFIVMFVIFMAVPFILGADARTLVPKHFESGGYGGPAFKFTSVKNKFSYMVGGGGAWIINHRITIGGMGFGLVSDLETTVGGNTHDIDMNYGGFDGGYVFFPDSVVHFTIHGTIGWGSVSSTDVVADTTESDEFFVIEPNVDAELNVLTWVRVCAGVSYRYVSGVTGVSGVNDSDLSGFGGTIFVKFGAF